MIHTVKGFSIVNKTEKDVLLELSCSFYDPADVGNLIIQFISVQSLSHVEFLWSHESQHARPLCPSPTPGVHSDSCPSSQWCHPTISSSVVPFSSCLHSFSSSGSYPMSQFFTSAGQIVGASATASVLPIKIQVWFPLGLTGLIFLQSKGLESSSTPQFKSINSSVLSFPCGPTLTPVHDYWKNHSFDYLDLCWQSNVSPF